MDSTPTVLLALSFSSLAHQWRLFQQCILLTENITTVIAKRYLKIRHLELREASKVIQQGQEGSVYTSTLLLCIGPQPIG